MEHPFEHLVGKTFLAHGKYAYRGKLKAVIGLHLIVDECEMLFRADAKQVVGEDDSDRAARPVYCGDGVVLHTDWFEAVVPGENCEWHADWQRAAEGEPEGREPWSMRT